MVPVRPRRPDAAQLLPLLQPYWQISPTVYLYQLQSGHHFRRVQALDEFLVQARAGSSA